VSGPSERPSQGRFVYRLGRALLRGYLTGYHRVVVEGREHLPLTGGALLVANHQSFLDIPMVAVGAPRHVAFVARRSLARSRFLDWLMRHSECVLIDPGSADRAALAAMIEHLQRGRCVAVFPEGTRTRDGAIGTFRGGAALAARRAGVPIVPAAILGAYEAWPRHHRLPAPRRVRIRFTPPLAPETPDVMQRARDAIATQGLPRAEESPSAPGQG
jgi:1-acyl-sn-glycerol-3-phosphate acyltransferase